MERFLEEIRSIGIFIICAQAVIHFRPKASYEKYLKVLTAIIVLVMLITPCFEILGNGEDFLGSMEQYENFWEGKEADLWKSYERKIEENRESAGNGGEISDGAEKENAGIMPIVIDRVEVTTE